MADTILVTGSTGNVGSQVVKQLSAATTKTKVRAAVTSKSRVSEIKDTNAELVEMNFNNPETVKTAFDDLMLPLFEYIKKGLRLSISDRMVAMQLSIEKL